MKQYKVAINLEWTSKCNALCAMCPREAITHPQVMSATTLAKALERISPDDVFRTVIAGYGEPTSHPDFMTFVDALRGHKVRFDMATNGQLLDETRLRHIDGVLGLLVISFSSIDPAVYSSVHVNLDQARVMENIALSQRTLKKTALAISLTPMSSCLDTLPQTIKWLHEIGVNSLTMSPTLYNRGGSLTSHEEESTRLRSVIAQYGLHSQELDFIPSAGDIARQCWKNKFRCIPRNTDLFIAADGNYLYCFNDISHSHTLGHINSLSVREALELREGTAPANDLCETCNLRGRYGLAEIAGVATKYLGDRFQG